MTHLSIARLALLLLLVALPARAQELTAPTAFEVSGDHVQWGQYRASVRVTPLPGGQLAVEREVRLADGTRLLQRGQGTQEPFAVRAVLPAGPGLAGALSGEPTAGPLELRLEHDGQGRCRVRTLSGDEQVSLARGATLDAPEVRLDVVVLSDLNGSYGSTRYGRPVRAAVEAVTGRLRPDLVLITGDMVAGQLPGWDVPSNHGRLRSTCRAMWSAFHEAVTRPIEAAGIPVAPAPGNHDASVWRPHERTLYAEAWPALRGVEPVDMSRYPFRYSFVQGGVFFLALDATRDGRLDDLDWVRAQLAAPRAQACPVRIAFGHMPLHATAEQRRDAVLHGSVEELFDELDLTLYVAGHHHAYYPGAAGGVRQVVMACLGGGRRPLIGRDTPSAHSLVALQVRDGALTAVEAFQGDAFDARVDRTALPARVDGLTRDDRAGYTSEWREEQP